MMDKNNKCANYQSAPNYAIIETLISDIETECVKLHNTFLENLFDVESYYKYISNLPIWLRSAGCDSDFAITKQFFESQLITKTTPLINRFLYLYDCQNVVSCLQNRYVHIIEHYRLFYETLFDGSHNNSFEDLGTICYYSGSKVSLTFANLNSIFIFLTSAFDIITKLHFELENLASDFEQYPKLRSKKILFGDNGRLINKSRINTIYDTSKEIRMVESIRNEIIHNGSWESNPKIFFEHKDGVVVDKWISMPEFDKAGNYQSYKNRNKFYDYSMDERVNVVLPDIVSSILLKIKNSINYLNVSFTSNSAFVITIEEYKKSFRKLFSIDTVH